MAEQYTPVVTTDPKHEIVPNQTASHGKTFPAVGVPWQLVTATYLAAYYYVLWASLGQIGFTLIPGSWKTDSALRDPILQDFNRKESRVIKSDSALTTNLIAAAYWTIMGFQGPRSG